ncbi:hypothetical protein PIB30_014988 [Stylosanthes scabra]|uniref:Uncharacterized protein n=1 Tax=Stylosanthes scabra TaxID=79078 RepID=A0ABU6X646_9FABA|nr:hypothetical protein [Stylosanthes scabra]
MRFKMVDSVDGEDSGASNEDLNAGGGVKTSAADTRWKHSIDCGGGGGGAAALLQDRIRLLCSSALVNTVQRRRILTLMCYWDWRKEWARMSAGKSTVQKRGVMQSGTGGRRFQ